MELEINEGITLVYQHKNDDYVAVNTKETHLNEIMQQFKNFLLCVGYNEKSVNEYINLN